MLTEQRFDRLMWLLTETLKRQQYNGLLLTGLRDMVAALTATFTRCNQEFQLLTTAFQEYEAPMAYSEIERPQVKSAKDGLIGKQAEHPDPVLVKLDTILAQLASRPA